MLGVRQVVKKVVLDAVEALLGPYRRGYTRLTLCGVRAELAVDSSLGLHGGDVVSARRDPPLHSCGLQVPGSRGNDFVESVDGRGNGNEDEILATADGEQHGNRDAAHRDVVVVVDYEALSLDHHHDPLIIIIVLMLRNCFIKVLRSSSSQQELQFQCLLGMIYTSLPSCSEA
jgi:hypothetical protein